MKKKQHTMPQDAKPDGKIFPGFSTVGPLPPKVEKALDVDDIETVIVIDKKKQMHLRASVFPPESVFPPKEEMKEDGFDSSGCYWKTTCKGSDGEPKQWVKEYHLVWPWCMGNHDPDEDGPCP